MKTLQLEWRRARWLSLAGILAFGTVAQAAGVSLRDGDIVVSESGSPEVVHVIDPSSGATRGTCPCESCNTLRDVAVHGTEKIYVTGGLSGGAEGVVEITPASCANRIVSSGDKFWFIFGIAVEEDGSILVADDSCAGCQDPDTGRYTGGVLRVNPATGAQTILSTGEPMLGPDGISVAPDGQIYVASQVVVPGCEACSGALRIDPTSGAQEVVTYDATNSDYYSPTDVAIESSSGPLYYMTTRYRGSTLQDEVRLFEVDLAGGVTSNHTLLTTGLEGLNRDRTSGSILGLDVRDDILYAVDYYFSSGSSSDYGGVTAFDPEVDEDPSEGTHLTDDSEFWFPSGLAIAAPEPGASALGVAALAALAGLARTLRPRRVG